MDCMQLCVNMGGGLSRLISTDWHGRSRMTSLLIPNDLMTSLISTDWHGLAQQISHDLVDGLADGLADDLTDCH
jgi:hypothetical protein